MRSAAVMRALGAVLAAVSCVCPHGASSARGGRPVVLEQVAHGAAAAGARANSVPVPVRRYALSDQSDAFDTELDNSWVNETVLVDPSRTAFVMSVPTRDPLLHIRSTAFMSAYVRMRSCLHDFGNRNIGWRHSAVGQMLIISYSVAVLHRTFTHTSTSCRIHSLAASIFAIKGGRVE